MGIAKTSPLSGKIVPIILLIFAVVSTVGIYAYNNILEGKSGTQELNIAETKLKITNIQKDPNLQVYKLLTDNARVIDKLTAESQVTTFIEKFGMIENKYFLNFGGFNYSAGLITTGAITSSDSSLASYSIVSDFIKGYRADKSAFFTLPLIGQVSGSDTMKFSVKFDVKDVLPKDILPKDIQEGDNDVKSRKQAILEANK